ncbi:MAG: hypothetical protein EP346_06920 [Bacteroidetes bacterium]|nr:MAG: hypothetical protein EP346_06920 [Bacteroidota bacterium]
MYDIYYKLIAERLKTAFPELQTVDLFTDQYYPDENGEVFINAPSAFIDLGERIRWEDTGTYTQEANIDLKVHLALDFTGDTSFYDPQSADSLQLDAAVFQYLQKLHQSLHGWQMKDQASSLTHSTKFTRISSERESQFMAGSLQVWIVTYRARIFDNSLNPDHDRTEFTIPSLSVNRP